MSRRPTAKTLAFSVVVCFCRPMLGEPPSTPVHFAFGFVVLRGLRPAELAELASVHSGSSSCSQLLVPNQAKAEREAQGGLGPSPKGTPRPAGHFRLPCV